jgi:hypothetical protein
MVFLDDGAIAKLSGVDPVLRDIVVAHEFGHTGALVHRDKTGNVMNSGGETAQRDCSDGFDADQLATLRATLAVGPAVASALSAHGAPAVEGADLRTPPDGRAAPWFAPERLGPLLRGDRAALQEFLAPLVAPLH